MKTTAYRDYLICKNVLNGLIWVSKEGQWICTAKSESDAMKKIDRLTGRA